MKKNFFLIVLLVCTGVQAQDFKNNLATAKTSYQAGKLQDTHFALQQIMQDLDITIGKEVLKLLPASIDTMQSITREEQVNGSSSFAGVTIRKMYGTGVKKAELNIIINSPLLTTLNAYITSPLMGSFGGDPNSRILKVGGYKGKLSREQGATETDTRYKLEIPLSNALLSFELNNTTESEILKWANSIPMDKIAAIIQ